MLFFEDQTAVQPKRMMYSTPMDTIQVEFDEHNKPDDLVSKVHLEIITKKTSGNIKSYVKYYKFRTGF